MKIQNIIGIFVVLLTYIVIGKADNVQSLDSANQALSNVVVKYESKFNNRAQFNKLQDAIDAIDNAMLGYAGKAKSRLDLVRELNSDARQKYVEWVGPVFEWCIIINGTIPALVPIILNDTTTESDRKRLWELVGNSLDNGREKTEKSWELLHYVQHQAAELKHLFDLVLHDVKYDFGSEGYYGKFKLEEMRQKEERQVADLAFVETLFAAIGVLIYGPIGLPLGLPAEALAFGIQTQEDWRGKQLLQEQLDLIESFFNSLDKKIEYAKKIVDEDQMNLLALQLEILGAQIAKDLVLVESTVLRSAFIVTLNKLLNHCNTFTSDI